jgi:putative ABC transport system ATP-binding protein
MIHIEQLTFQYPDGPFRMKVPALTVPTGSSLALTGRSGCGKSTLIRLIAGIEPPTSGQITIDGEDLTTQSDVQRRIFRAAHIGLVFQDFQLLDYLNAWENIILPYRLTAALTLTPQTLDRGKEAAHQCGIDHLLPAASTASPMVNGNVWRSAALSSLIPEFFSAMNPLGASILTPQNPSSTFFNRS